MCICIRGGFTCPPAFFLLLLFSKNFAISARTSAPRPILLCYRIIKLRLRLQTVHSPLFFRKIVEIERAAILHESKLLRGRGRYNPRRPRPRYLRRAISRRQSTPTPSLVKTGWNLALKRVLDNREKCNVVLAMIAKFPDLNSLS